MCQLAVDQEGALAEIVIDAGVDHLQGAAALGGEYIDGGAAGQKILDHLPGDVLGICRNPFGDNAMVGGKHQDGGLTNRDIGGVLDQADLFGKAFQQSQAAERLGLVIDDRVELQGEGGIGGGGKLRNHHRHN